MKTSYIFILLLSVMSSNVYAKCFISSERNMVLGFLLEEKKWSFKNYHKLCKELKNINAGIQIVQTMETTEHQTIVSTSVKAYPKELKEQYMTTILTKSGHSKISIEKGITNETKAELIYQSANEVLNQLITMNKIEDIKEDIKKIRAIYLERSKDTEIEDHKEKVDL